MDLPPIRRSSSISIPARFGGRWASSAARRGRLRGRLRRDRHGNPLPQRHRDRDRECGAGGVALGVADGEQVGAEGEAVAGGEIWQDSRLIWAMIRDPSYAIPWLTKLVVVLPLAYIGWSTLAGFHNGFLGLFGYVLDVILLVPLLYLTFKTWQRELRRYRHVRAGQAARR